MKPAKSTPKESEKIQQLTELTWKQLEALNRDKTVIFIPISPLEEHGPHLPVGTDLLIAMDTSKEAMKLVIKKRPDVLPLLYPAIPFGHTGMAQGFPGSVSVPVKTIATIVQNSVSSFADYGFHFFVICTFHMDLGHLKGIYAGMKKTRKMYPIQIIEPWGPYFYGHDVECREPKANFDTHLEIHGCYRETSLMAYQYPYLVDPVYKTLPPYTYDVYSPKALGKTFKDVGANEGYIGSPAQASSDYGRWFFQEIVETITTATLDMMEGHSPRDLPAKTKLAMRSMFWL